MRPLCVNDDKDHLDIVKTTPNTKENSYIPVFAGQVLVADNCLGNQVQARLLLQKLGFEVTVADTGQQAVNAIENNRYDLIFMDMQMLVMEGYEATQLLRSQSVQTPIIALTADTEPQDRNKCIDTGCSDSLPKPIDSSQLVHIIDKFLKPTLAGKW